MKFSTLKRIKWRNLFTRKVMQSAFSLLLLRIGHQLVWWSYYTAPPDVRAQAKPPPRWKTSKMVRDSGHRKAWKDVIDEDVARKAAEKSLRKEADRAREWTRPKEGEAEVFEATLGVVREADDMSELIDRAKAGEKDAQICLSMHAVAHHAGKDCLVCQTLVTPDNHGATLCVRPEAGSGKPGACAPVCDKCAPTKTNDQLIEILEKQMMKDGMIDNVLGRYAEGERKVGHA